MGTPNREPQENSRNKLGRKWLREVCSCSLPYSLLYSLGSLFWGSQSMPFYIFHVGPVTETCIPKTTRSYRPASGCWRVPWALASDLAGAARMSDPQRQGYDRAMAEHRTPDAYSTLCCGLFESPHAGFMFCSLTGNADSCLHVVW